MTLSEYKAVMDELNIPKFEIKKGMKFSLKEKLRIKLHDYRDTGEGIYFLHNIHSICMGDIPSSVIRDTYFRLGKECFMRGDKFETLRHNDLNQSSDIRSFRIGNLRDFLVFYDTFLRYLSHKNDYDDERPESIDVNAVYARIVEKLFEEKKEQLSKTPRELINRKFKPYSEQPEDEQDFDKLKVGYLLEEFDKAVNPLLDGEFEFGNIYDFAKRNDMSINYDSLRIGTYNKDYTSYKYNDNHMYFESDVAVKTDKKKKTLESLSIRHYYTKKDLIGERFQKPYESLDITRHDRNGNPIYILEFNLTSGKRDVYFKDHDISKEDLQRIAKDLKDALAVIKERNKALSADNGNKVLSLENKEQNN